MDFTLNKYTDLLRCFQKHGYQFVTFENYCQGIDDGRFVILRHDVDKKAENSLVTAKLEASFGIKASYYFRVTAQSNKPGIIKEIVDLGHEVGYHYEDFVICQGDAEKAIAHFREKLALFRQYYPVKTICAHGAPRSKFDSRDLWKQYDYHDYGILGEPYFDIDYSKVFYLTDTGRRWDGFNVSLRDKIPAYQDEWVTRGWVYHTTDDVLKALEDRTLPQQLMMTTHPQRWNDNLGPWLKERLMQSAKNVVKGWLMN